MSVRLALVAVPFLSEFYARSFGVSLNTARRISTFQHCQGVRERTNKPGKEILRNPNLWCDSGDIREGYISLFHVLFLGARETFLSQQIH